MSCGFVTALDNVYPVVADTLKVCLSSVWYFSAGVFPI